MKSEKLFKVAVIIGIIGLVMILSVVLSNTAYPDLVFKVLTPLGLLFIFVSIILGFISWIWMIKDAAKTKQYSWAVLLALLGMFIIIKEAIRVI